MAYDLLRKCTVPGNFSINADVGVGSWWNPFSHAETKDEKVVDEAEEKLNRAKKQLKLNKEAESLRDKAKTAQEKADRYKDDSKGISGADRDRDVEENEDGSKFC